MQEQFTRMQATKKDKPQKQQSVHEKLDKYKRVAKDKAKDIQAACYAEVFSAEDRVRETLRETIYDPACGTGGMLSVAE